MPPPAASRPFGAVAAAELPLTTPVRSVRLLPSSLRIPPPSAWAVTGPVAALPVTRVRIRVSVPQLSIPPPPACANGHGPAGHFAVTLGTAVGGSGRFPP